MNSVDFLASFKIYKKTKTKSTRKKTNYYHEPGTLATLSGKSFGNRAQNIDPREGRAPREPYENWRKRRLAGFAVCVWMCMSAPVRCRFVTSLVICLIALRTTCTSDPFRARRGLFCSANHSATGPSWQPGGGSTNFSVSAFLVAC